MKLADLTFTHNLVLIFFVDFPAGGLHTVGNVIPVLLLDHAGYLILLQSQHGCRKILPGVHLPYNVFHIAGLGIFLCQPVKAAGAAVGLLQKRVCPLFHRSLILVLRPEPDQLHPGRPGLLCCNIDVHLAAHHPVHFFRQLIFLKYLGQERLGNAVCLFHLISQALTELSGIVIGLFLLIRRQGYPLHGCRLGDHLDLYDQAQHIFHCLLTDALPPLQHPGIIPDAAVQHAGILVFHKIVIDPVFLVGDRGLPYR